MTIRNVLGVAILSVGFVGKVWILSLTMGIF